MKKTTLRYLVFLVGLLLTGIGVALSTKMGLGTTPISVIPLVISRGLPISFGMTANIMSLCFVLIEFLLQRRKLTRDLILQIIIAPFFGYFVDLGFFLFSNLVVGTFLVQIVYLIIGCMAMALGISMQIKADVIVNPCEGLVLSIANRLSVRFSSVKIMVDVGVMLIGVAFSLLLFGEVVGVGIATVVVALLTGLLVKVFRNLLNKAWAAIA